MSIKQHRKIGKDHSELYEKLDRHILACAQTNMLYTQAKPLNKNKKMTK